MSRLIPAQAEGDINTSNRREQWQQQYLDDATHRLLQRDAGTFLHQSVSTPCLSGIRKAEGIWIEDLQGRRLMDFHGNSVHHIGYAHRRLVEAVTQQIQDLSFAPRRYTCEVAVQLAEYLTELAPGDLSKVLLAPSGSNAVEMAMAYARAATGRYKMISFWDAFHGAGFGARSVGGEQMFRSGSIGPLLTGVEHVPPFGDYRNAWGVTQGSADLCARQIRYILEKEGDVCAVIAEPTRSVPYIPPAGFWRDVRAACDEFGALLIFDEIPSGLGKTGRMFACEHEEVVPDILVLGKALGGAMLPVAAMLCRADLDVASDFAHGHFTHEKNPITARAALTTLQIIAEENLVSRAQGLEQIALDRLREMMSRHRLIGDVRGRGCLWGVELVRDRQTREPAPDAADAVLYHALSRGLSFKTTMGNVLTLSPPLVTTSEQLHQALNILDDSLSAVVHGL